MEKVEEEEVVKVVDKKKKVIIAVPGDVFSSKFLINWTNTIITLWSSDKYDVAIAAGTGSFVPYVRMQTLGLDTKRGKLQKPFNGDNYDIWLTIDSDVMFTSEQVLHLLDATEKHPVVSGMYRMTDLEHFSTIHAFDDAYFAENGKYEYLTSEYIEKWRKDTELTFMPVAYSGLGFMACRKEVLEKMNYPYFQSDVHEIPGKNGEILVDLPSEDMAFCKNITKAGYEIVLDTGLRVGHSKQMMI